MRVMVGLWIAGLVGGVILGLAFREFAYRESGDSDGGIDLSYASEISTARSPLSAQTSPTTTGTLEAQSETATGIQTPMATLTEDTPPTRTPIPSTHLTGNGTSVSDPVMLTKGVAVVTASHQGAGRFQVTAFDGAGNQLGRTANGFGTWTGSSSLVVPDDGSYVFEVVADGEWTIDINYPVADVTTISALPFSYSGSGVDSIYFLQAPTGTHRLAAQCDGEGPLRVSAVSIDGAYRRVLLDATCPFNGTVAFPVPGRPFDVFLIDVTTATNWTLSIE